MNKPEISIIIPVYNAEPYLSRCIDSLLSQTYQDFEILMIDDGSTDSSGAICEKYAQKDGRIRVTHQSNSGVAATRQHGIDMAQGVYSIHVDPDDWVAPTMLEELHNTAISTRADMVVCDLLIIRNDGEYCLSQKLISTESDSCMNQLLAGKLHGSLCNKLIRTALYKEFDVTFTRGLNYCEDFLTCVQLLLHNIKIEYISRPLYYYDQVVNNNSITRNYNIAVLNQRLKFLGILHCILNGKFDTGFSEVASNIAYECLRSGILTSQEFAKAFRCYANYFNLSQQKKKHKVALNIAASGYQWIARRFIKTR